MEELDLSKEIKKILLNSNRSKEIKSGEEVNKLSKKKFLGVHTHEFGLKDKVFEGIPIENVLMGFSLSGGCVVFSKNKFCISNGMINKYRLFSISQLRKLSIERDGLTSDSVFLNGERVGNFNRQSIDPWKRICDEINLFFKPYLQIKLKEHEEHEKKKQIKLEREKKEEYEQMELEMEKREKDEQIKLEKEKKEEDEQIKLEKEKKEKDEQIKLEKEKKEKDEYLKLIKELDKDNNGLIDVVEGNDFSNILKKNQQEIININRDYIKQFVQVSNFLKTKRNSLQSVYENIVEGVNTGGTYISLDSHLKQIDFNNIDKLDLVKKINENTKIGPRFSKEIVDSYRFGKPNPHPEVKFYTPLNKNLIKKYFEILKDDIHIYNVLLISSLNMVESLIKNDMITFYEVYERFDELNMFDSKYERDIKHQLQNVNDNLGEVMNQIVNMGENIISSINDLSMITEESSKLITEGLESVNSSIKVNNLISTIQSYQLYRIGKNTKSLRG